MKLKLTSYVTAAVGGLLLISVPTTATLAAEKSADSVVIQGQKIAYTRKLGNCLACHLMSNGESPGNFGPPLIAMKARYPDKSKLRAQIWNATIANPDTSMPPFGKHEILTEQEIDKVVEFVWSL
jgi:sulfur-oxidizing protein SoxX